MKDHESVKGLSVSKPIKSERFPLSYHQQRIWFIDQFEKGNVYRGAPIYHNIPLNIEINGHVDINLLQKSIDVLISANSVLRTRLEIVEARGYQKVVSDARVEIVKHVLTNEKADVLIEAANDFAKVEFDLENESLVRAALFEGKTGSVLSIVFHHLIVDRVSCIVFAKDLSRIYSNYKSGAQVEPFTTTDFYDYATWQLDLDESVWEPCLYFWRDYLKQPLQILSLPEKRKRSDIHKYEESYYSCTIPLEEISKSYVDSASETINTKLLAVFCLVMNYYSGQEEIVVGLQDDERISDRIKTALGPYSNLVVFKTNVEKDGSVSDYFESVDSQYKEIEPYKTIPFEYLVKKLQPAKDMSRTALFDVLVGFYDCFDVPEFCGHPATLKDRCSGFGKNDFHVLFVKGNTNLEIKIVFNSLIYDERLSKDIAESIKCALVNLRGDEKYEIGRIDWLFDNARNLQNSYLNANAELPYISGTIVSEFKKNALNYKDKIAVKSNERSLSYRELDRKSNQLARYLTKQGVNRGAFVPIIMKRSPDIAVAILSVLKSGGAYVFIEPDAPKKRVSSILAELKPNVIICDCYSLHEHDDLGCHAVNICDDAISIQDDGDYLLAVDPDDSAYCIYTSGSTGIPKAVVVNHRSVLRLFSRPIERMKFSSQDVWTVNHSFSFDFSVWELWGALLFGGKAIVVDSVISKDVLEFARLIKNESVTVLNQTPSYFYALLDAMLDNSIEAESAKYIIFGGEKLSPARIGGYKNVMPKASAINMYGITESTVHATYHEITDMDIVENRSVIGRSIPGSSLYVLDGHLNPVGQGIVGELYISGSGLAEQYLKRPSITAERFLPNPFSDEHGSRIYKTGDMVRLNYQGNLEYIGRMDNQVQINGFRIELGEIESRIKKKSQVRDVVVDVRSPVHNVDCLVAYIQLSNLANEETGIETIRVELNATLPAYMLPKYYVVVDSFPMTKNGKLDAAALPDPDINKGTTEYAAPTSPEEEVLKEILEDVLGIENVSCEANFFELGGDSISAIRILSKAKEKGLHVVAEDVFRHQTIRGIAKCASQVDVDKNVNVNAGRLHRITPTQEWFFDLDLKNKNHWNQAVMLGFKEYQPTSILIEKIKYFIESKDIFRAKFTQEVDGWKVEEALGDSSSISVIEVDSYNQILEEDLLYRSYYEAASAINIEDGPLVSIVLYQDRAMKTMAILIIVHHLVIDNVSWQLISDEFVEYFQNDGEKDARFRITDWQYDYVEYLVDRYRASGVANRESINYWKGIDWESARSSTVNRMENNCLFSSIRKKDLYINLSDNQVAQINSSSMAMRDVLLLALCQSYCRVHRQEYCFVNIEGHGRDYKDDIDISNSIGWFTQIFPFLFYDNRNIGEEESIRIFERKLRECLKFSNDYLPLRYLSDHSKLGSDKGHPKPEIIYNFNGVINEKEGPIFKVPVDFNNLRSSMENACEHLLELNAHMSGSNTLSISLYYASDVYGSEIIETTLESLKGQFLANLDKLNIENEEVQILDDQVHHLLGEFELEDLLNEMED